MNRKALYHSLNEKIEQKGIKPVEHQLAKDQAILQAG